MGIGILCIATIYEMAKVGSKCKKQTLDGLFNTGRVGGGNTMEGRGRTRGAITAVAGTASAISLDGICPMGAEDDAIFGAGNRFSPHAELVEMVKLFVLTSTPLMPGVELLELASGKGANGLLSWGDMSLDSLEEDLDLVSGESLGAKIDVRMADGGNGTDVSHCESGDMLIFGFIGFEDVVFQ